MSDESIFAAALDKADPAERAAFLDQVCPDPTARERLDRLLAAHDRAGSFLNRPAATAEFPTVTARAGAGTATPDEAAAFLAPSARPDAIGRLGHYDVLQVLGKGAFGTVFRAFDDVLQRVVAVKVMAPLLAATSPARKRFLREARSSAQVRHENVVQVYEVGEDPLPYIVMEFIPGETLQQRLNHLGPVDAAEVVRVGRQLAEGLAAAHASDLIHRDIKPGNVLLESGQHRVKITDFGLARAADDASLTQSGVIAGTPMYMAPEQATGERLDQRADLFSLGSVLYQMAAGHPPFRASSTVAVLKRVAEDTPRDIREVMPETPQWLCDIIAKLHAKDPADRYQSAREVADVLADCEEQLKANSRLKDYSLIPRPTEALPAPVNRRRTWAGVAAVALLAVAATAIAAVGLYFLAASPVPPAAPDTTQPVLFDSPATVSPATAPSAAPPTTPKPAPPTTPSTAPSAVPQSPAVYREVHGVDRAAFTTWLAEAKRAKYVPHTLAAWATEKGQTRFAAVAASSPSVKEWDVHFSGRNDDLKSRNDALHAQGFRAAVRASYPDGADVGFADLWVKDRFPVVGPLGVFGGGLPALQDRLAKYHAEKLRPTGHAVTQGGKKGGFYTHTFAADLGPRWEVMTTLTAATLKAELATRRAANWRLEGLAVHGFGGQSQFVAQFTENTDRREWAAGIDLSAAEYEKELAERGRHGLRPRQVSAREYAGAVRYAVVWDRPPAGRP
ncbi:MAG: protein kinase [Gemmataceae bacterium]